MNNMMPNMSHPSAPPQSPYHIPSRNSQPPKRPDMKGPSDIDDILSGLKPKQNEDAMSAVSLSELKEMKEGVSKPRRKKSDKNTMNLDI
jgi:hypothetical protein